MSFPSFRRVEFVHKTAGLFIACLVLASCAAPDGEVAESGGVTENATAEKASFDLETGRPMVMAKINGEGPFPFVFDTGSPGLLLQQDIVEQLGIAVTGSRGVNSPAGGEPVEMGVVQIGALAIGSTVAENVEGLVMNFGGSELGAGVIGPAVFRDYGRTLLDFENNEVVLGGAVSSSADGEWIEFGSSAPLFDAEITIGGATIPAHIDTGAPHILTVPEQYADSLPLVGPMQVIGRARTIDREFELNGAPIAASAKLSDAEIPLVMVIFNDLPIANLGTGGLRGLTLEIDWTQERFRLSGVATPVAVQPRRVRVERPAEGE